MKTTPAVSLAMRSRSNSSLASHVLAALAAAGLASSAQAAQITWQGNVSGNMSDAANWVGGVAPAASGDGVLFGVAGTAGTTLTLNGGANYGNVGGALVFASGAPSYVINGTGALTVSTGSIVNNSGTLQTFNKNLTRNTSNPLTIGAHGGIIDINGTYDIRASGLANQLAFGTTQGGIIAFNGGFVNTGAAATYTVTLPTLTAPAFGTVVFGGNSSVLNGNVTLGANTALKLASADAVSTGQSIITVTQTGNDVLWLASNAKLNDFNLTSTDGQASRHTVILGTGTSGAAVSQDVSSLRLSPQHLNNFIKAGNVLTGTPALNVTGTTTLGSDGTSGRATILAANGVNLTLGNVTGTSATSQVILVLDGSTSSSAINGVINNGVGGGIAVTKAGTGTWSLTRANTANGTTAVNNGTLKLDFNATDAPASDILYNGITPGAVSLAGGALRLEGKNAAASTQAFGAMSSLGSTGGSEIILRAGAGEGSSMNATVTGLTLNTGSTLNFDLGAGTSFRNTSIVAAAAAGQGAFFNNNNYARYDASGYIIEATTINFATQASVLGNNTGSTSSYFLLEGGQTRSAGLSFKGLRIANTADSQTLDLGGTAQTFSNSSIIYRGGNDNIYTIGNGTLSGGTSNLIFQVVAGATLNVSNDVNLGAGLAASFTKSGDGTLVVSGNKTFTGRWNITKGVLSIDSIANGALESGLGASTNTAGGLYLYGGTLRYTGAAASTDRSFTVGSAGATIDASGSGALTWAPASGLAFGFNTNNSLNTTTAAQNQRLTFTGNSTADNTFGSATGLLADPTNVGRLQVTKEGSGKWILNQANTYTGGTIINDGTLAIANSGALGTIGPISFGGGTLQFGSGITPDLSHRLLNSTAAIKLDTNGNSVTLATRINETNIGGLTKLGAGTLTLSGSNSYTGNTTVETGTLALSGSLASPVLVNTGANLQFTLGAASVPVATTTGNLTLAGNSTVTVVGTPAPDTTYTLLSATGVTGTPVLSSPIAGFSLVAESGSLKLKPASAADTTAPAAPSVALLAASDTGSSGTDLITKLTTPTLRVNLAGSGDTAPVAGDVVKLFAGATEVASATLVAGDITAGYVDLTTSTLTAGAISFTATVTDAANNVSAASAALVVTLDTSSPVINLNGAASLTSDWGTAYSDAGATASDNVDASVSVVTVNPVVSSTPGVYTVTYNATDVAGNNAAQVTRSVTVSIANASTLGADGLSPLMKYAFGATSPSDTVQAPATSATATELKLTAVVRTNDANLTVTAETNTDLAAPGSWTVTGVTESLAADQTNLPAGCVRKVYSVSITGASKKFLRIKAASTF
jgi:autotransporter-associated beta strand protein